MTAQHLNSNKHHRRLVNVFTEIPIMRSHGLNMRELAERCRRRSAASEMGKYLSTVHWQVFATPTYSDHCAEGARCVPRSMASVRADILEWLAGLGADVYAYVAIEVGPAGGRTHSHVLVGGLYRGSQDVAGIERQREALLRATRSWKHGKIDLMPYDPKQGAAWYVAKNHGEEEIVGTLKRHQRHRPHRGRPSSTAVISSGGIA